MELTALTAHLTDRQTPRLVEVVAALEAAVASGIVPNTLFTDAKEWINRAVQDGAERFLASGPHVGPGKGDWWHGAYHADAFVSGAHTLPTVLKRAQKACLTEYAGFVAALIPLRDLLEAAKPLIKKRGELPKVATAKEIADDAKRMTCQCCARRIFAELGSIAHHGYERPGSGWQTQSCMGAKELPFEVSRDRLGDLLVALRGMIKDAGKHLTAVHADRAKLAFSYDVYKGYRRIAKQARVTQAWFLADDVQGPALNRLREPTYDITTWAVLKTREIANTESEIRQLKVELVEQTKRYDGWKQTHVWFGKSWEKI